MCFTADKPKMNIMIYYQRDEFRDPRSWVLINSQSEDQFNWYTADKDRHNIFIFLK